ncbi:hypothetical protein B0H14DRAFT_2592043 [Mycena olivaceomarginata]|nr:hypothetical protein B0H14DRAFT_2592043 [Mycena olivaceomarginata]
MPLFPVQSFCFLLVLTLLAVSPWTPTNATPQMNRRQNGSDPTPSAFSPSPSSTVSADYSVTTSAVLGGVMLLYLVQVLDGPVLTCDSTINNYTNITVLGSLNISLGCEYLVYTVNEVIPNSNLDSMRLPQVESRDTPNCTNAQNGVNYCLSANANTSPVMLNGVPTDAPVQGVQVDIQVNRVFNRITICIWQFIS